MVVDICRYQVTVSATTSVGSGPQSDVVYVGMETTEPPPSTAALQPSSTSVIKTTPTSSESTPTSGVTTPILGVSTPTPVSTTVTEAVPSKGDDKDAVFYAVRIVPPIIGFIALITLVMGVVFYLVRLRYSTDRRKNVYQCMYVTVARVWVSVR